MPDGVYDSVRTQFSSGELANLTIAITQINLWNRLNSTSPSALCLEDTSRVCSGPNSARRNRSQAHLIEVVAASRPRSQVPAY